MVEKALRQNFSIQKNLEPIIGNPVIEDQMNDIIKYQTMEYYRRRYRNSRQRKEQKCTNSKQ